jgi:chromosome segregation ATPase
MAGNPNNTHLTDAALAELDRLHAETGTSCDKWLKACMATFNAYQPMRQRLTDAESRLAEAERERYQLRALADTARDGMRQLGEALEASRAEVEDIRQQRDYWQEEAVEMRRYKEASESLLAGLRGALEEAGDVIHACFCETEEIRGKVCHPSCIAINTALTITPASAANRTDEETEAANGR